MTCALFDISCHVQGWFWGLVALVPWWAWLVAAVLAAVAVWRLLGWPGVVALGVLAGFVLGRRNEPYPTDLPEKDARPPFGRPKVRVRTRTAKRGPQPPESLTK